MDSEYFYFLPFCLGHLSGYGWTVFLQISHKCFESVLFEELFWLSKARVISKIVMTYFITSSVKAAVVKKPASRTILGDLFLFVNICHLKYKYNVANCVQMRAQTTVIWFGKFLLCVFLNTNFCLAVLSSNFRSMHPYVEERCAFVCNCVIVIFLQLQSR